MTEKFKKEIDHEYWAYAHAVNLAVKCHNRDSQSANTAGGGTDGAIKQNTLFEVLSSEAACTAFRLTPKGYLKAIWTLFKIAFIEKEFKSGIPLVGAILLK